jgi:hypothetical protein
MDTDMTFVEKPKVVVKEEVTLEKFEGDILVERLYIVDGIIEKSELFEDGELVDTKIGGIH